MSELYLSGPILILLVACIIFIYSKFKMKKPSLLDIEKGLEPIFSIVCTILIDTKRHAFSRFAVYDEFIVISNHDKILFLSNPINITVEQIIDKISEVEAEDASQEYARNRKAEYDPLDQFEMQYDDEINGTTTWKDAIAEIKTKWPKDNSGPV